MVIIKANDIYVMSSACQCGGHFSYITFTYFSRQLCELGIIIILTGQKRKVSHREGKQSA